MNHHDKVRTRPPILRSLPAKLYRSYRSSLRGAPVRRQATPPCEIGPGDIDATHSSQCTMNHNNSPSQPTPEMVAFYERRTNEHIERVRECLSVMASVTDHADELRERARVHDASKFGEEERLPYIWLTEFHRCRRGGEPFAYPDGMAERVDAAIRHHVSTNRHHPEFHADPNEMTDVDLIEMVCDWTAMSQELGQDDGSARGWADKTLGTRLRLNDERRTFVYRMIELLDAHGTRSL